MNKTFVAFIAVVLFFTVTALMDNSSPTGQAGNQTTIQTQNIGGKAIEVPKQLNCETDRDCVPEGCCHAASCTLRESRADCSNVYCTLDCKPNTLDCGQGSCRCIQGKCLAVLN